MGVSPFQIVLILVLGVLIFGKNLPEVAKQIGLGLMEFKKGMNELRESPKSSRVVRERRDADHFSSGESTDKHESYGAKFEPPE